MAVTMNPPATNVAGERPGAHERSFEVEIEHHGDATRFARIASALVNPSPVALASAAVDGTVVYPVAAAVPLSGTVVRLRFRTRDRQRPVDPALIDSVVARLAGHGVILGVTRAG